MEPWQPTKRDWTGIRPALAAAVVLAVGLGFGRFAFTGLYPIMVAENLLTVSGGAFAASANYGGYLLGALLMSVAPKSNNRTLCAASTAVTILCLAVLAVPMPEFIVVLTRLVAGISSAVAMVAASQWLIHEQQQAGRAPVLFSGVGVGILLSAELIAAGSSLSLGSRQLWLLVASVALILAIPAYLAMRRAPHRQQPSPGDPATGHHLQPLSAARLIGIYSLYSFGYVITATYLPLIVGEALQSIEPLQVWAAFGLGAIPSCFLWHRVHVGYGTRRALAINLLVQATGVALPVFAPSAIAYLASAVLVGGTFLGTVTIVMPVARLAAHSTRFNMLATITAGAGFAQIVGPLVADRLFARYHSFDPALLLAAAALLACAGACFGGMANEVAIIQKPCTGSSAGNLGAPADL